LPERFGFDTKKSSIFKFDFDRSIKREEALEKMKRPAYNPEKTMRNLNI
jgi:hypothetical protein